MAWKRGAVGLAVLCTMLAIEHRFLPACAFTGFDVADLDSDVRRKPRPGLKPLDSGVQDLETEGVKKKVEKIKTQLPVTDAGRKLNPDIWGKQEVELFEAADKLKKLKNKMYGIGGGFLTAASGLGYIGARTHGDILAPFAIAAVVALLGSAPFFAVGAVAAKKHKKKLKELLDAEKFKVYQKIERDRILRLDEEASVVK